MDYEGLASSMQISSVSPTHFAGAARGFRTTFGVTVRREKALYFSGCKSRPGTGSLHPVAIEAAVEATKLVGAFDGSWGLRPAKPHENCSSGFSSAISSRGCQRHFALGSLPYLLHETTDRLDAWIVHRLYSHRHKRWRTRGWKQLPETTLCEDLYNKT